MSNRSQAIRCLFALAAGSGILALVLAGVVASHEGEKHVTDSTVVAPAADADTNRDSVYTVIRVGYENLKPVFESACFDCHSDKTLFPWYHSLPIIKGWMDGHLREAREHLDFSNGFPFGGHASQADNLYSLKEEISSGEMPLWQYRLMHWGAAPNAEEKDSIYAWVDRGLIMLAAHGEYPLNKPENVPGPK